MTSISLYGAYEQADADYAQPRYGHPKDRRPDLKQIQTGIGTSADGGIPVFHRAYDGGAAEVSQVTGAMTALNLVQLKTTVAHLLFTGKQNVADLCVRRALAFF